MNELKGRERYQQKRNDYCANMVASTSQTYQDFVQTARELSRTLENLNTTLFLTNQCVDSTYLLSHRSEYEFYPRVLQNSSFNCDSLSICEITCTPPNNPILQE